MSLPGRPWGDDRMAAPGGSLAGLPAEAARPAAAAAAAALLACAAAAAQAAAPAPGADAGSGDAARGAAIAASRSQGLCVLCHALPGQPAALSGSIGPPLAGVGARLDAAALRQRLVAPQQFNPDTVMPAYGVPVPGLQQVAPAWAGKPLLSPAQVDDVVAWLATLR